MFGENVYTEDVKILLWFQSYVEFESIIWVYYRYRSQKIGLLSATLIIYFLQGNWLQIEYKNQALEYIETKSESKPNAITCNTYFIVFYYDEFFRWIEFWAFSGLYFQGVEAQFIPKMSMISQQKMAAFQ